MGERKLLVVGIDPGITTAYAILDLDGNLLHVDSSKQLELSSIIYRTMDFGKVLLVGTDKAKVPSLVESFAAKLGARISKPEEDLKVDEKRLMTQGFEFHDAHQGDALASAMFALRTIKPLLEKIEKFCDDNKKDGIKEKIKELVISKKTSIRDAASIVEKKGEEDIIVEKVISEKVFRENDFLRLHRKVKEYQREIMLVKNYSNYLKNKIRALEEAKETKPAMENKKTGDMRLKRALQLENKLRFKDRDIEQLKSHMTKFNEIFANIDDFYLLKKLDNLGSNEFEFKNRILNIRKNDILLVDDASIFSDKVVQFLKEKVFVIVHKKQATGKIKEMLPFIFLSAEKMKIHEEKYFAFARKKEMDMEKGRIDWARKIIEDYKKEKEGLILG